MPKIEVGFRVRAGARNRAEAVVGTAGLGLQLGGSGPGLEVGSEIGLGSSLVGSCLGPALGLGPGLELRLGLGSGSRSGSGLGLGVLS